MILRSLRNSLLSLCLVASAPVYAQGVAGSYLAASHASRFSDFTAASEYYSRAISADPRNGGLIESAALAYLGLGRIDRAATVSRRLISLGAGNSQIANMAILTEGLHRENFDQVIDDLDAGATIGPLVDGLLRAWAILGTGQMSVALEAFDAVATTDGIEVFGLYHKALALASVGDLEAADAILAEGLQLNRRGVVAHAQVLSQLDRNADAIALVDQSFGEVLDPEIALLRQRLAAGEVLDFEAIRSPVDGAAEVFMVVASALNGEAADNYTLLYSRLAEYLRPDSVDAVLLSASLLENLERYALATETYVKVPRDHPSFDAAELGRAEALRLAGNTDAAIEAMQQLARSHGSNPDIHITLGDTFRRLERYDEASRAYDAAIALYPAPEQPQWLVFFARGITHEREKRWELAEADFRKALELNPGQPQVLNYLGYSFVEMGINLEEATAMIKEAVAQQPDSGYIVDSLGWVQFQLGEYEEAVVNLERATELLAVDPIINDHLGDAYWAVGRVIEAEFQWKRALSFEPTEKDAERIRKKLEIGLDAVLEEEGADPLIETARDG